MSEPTETEQTPEEPVAEAPQTPRDQQDQPAPQDAATAEPAAEGAEGAEESTAANADAAGDNAQGDAATAEKDDDQQTDNDNQQERATEMSKTDSGFDLKDFTDVAATSAGNAAENARLQRILRLEVPVIVKVAEKQLPLGDVINLSPGSIIEFSRSSEQPLELQVNNKIIGKGSAVKVGEKFGLRINRIAQVSEKIRSLGT